MPTHGLESASGSAELPPHGCIRVVGFGLAPAPVGAVDLPFRSSKVVLDRSSLVPKGR
ncbi:hypothetical protein BT63DRAFT_36273 [Microthyrium microscopicum]|uniref:Uncharacterized protein n=1 Tax=Microthyrium microscopicum TaxID=703497 RepID=A0A6A6UTE7_9PEZI|nr:hypothetical protein BT63DRAFT_36273 [Microthyrium microscopicum]